MKDDPTSLQAAEAKAALDATRLEEPSAAGSGAEPSLGGPDLFAPGTALLGYRVIKPFEVFSAEADLWLVENDQGVRAVLKLYRYGIRPKADVLAALMRQPHPNLIRIFATGEMNGRVYELQEYLPLGSLASRDIEGPCPEPRARAILEQVAAGLGWLHEAGILHRDLKPSNLLVRQAEPLEIVLSDFGIASFAQVELNATTLRRTPRYAAPEAVIGVVAKASDWWSVGVILLELLAGRHPLADCASEEGVNMQLVSAGIPVPENLPGRWPLLLRGLLTRDYARRWGFEQVGAWLGGAEPPVYYETPQAGGQAPSVKPYRFDGREWHTPGDVAVALAANWPEGIKRVARGSVALWLKMDVRDFDLSGIFEDLMEDRSLDAEQRFAAALLALHPRLPLSWRGKLLTVDLLRAEPGTAAALLESGLPDWLLKLRGDRWLVDLRERRRRMLDFLRQTEIEFDPVVAERAALADPDVLQALARETAQGMLRSSHPRLQELLEQNQWSDEEAALLIAADRSLWRTKPEEWRRERKRHDATLRTIMARLNRLPIPWKVFLKIERDLDAVEDLTRRKREELGAPVPTANEDGGEDPDLLREARARIAAYFQCHAQFEAAASLAEAGQIHTARARLEEAARLFSDLPVEPVESAIKRWEDFYQAPQAEFEAVQRDFAALPEHDGSFFGQIQFLTRVRRLRRRVRRLAEEITRRRQTLVADSPAEFSAAALDVFDRLQNELPALETGLASRETAARPRQRRALLFTIAGSVVVLLAFHGWMLARTRLQFDLEAGEKPVAPDTETRALWNGQPVRSGDRVAPGAGTFRVVSSYYGPVTLTRAVDYGLTENLGRISLHQGVGVAAIRSVPPGARFILTGPDVSPIAGAAPEQLSLPAGRYEITARLGDWTQTRQITVEPETAAPVEFPFLYGSLTVASNPPGATVFLNRAEAGVTPLDIPKLKPGPVELELRLADYEPAVASAAIVSERPSAVAVNLVRRVITNSLGMRFNRLPGTPLFFSIWETRQRDFNAFLRATGRAPAGPANRDLFPAVEVSWAEARDFCRWLTDQERLEKRIGPGDTYRLPTDLEWSRAVGLPPEPGATPAERDGAISGVYPWGTRWPPPANAGNYAKKLPEATQPAGQTAPNAFGLYDLGGNAWEWCEDWYDAAQTGRVSRGASAYDYDPRTLLSSKRNAVAPETKSENLGFRCVLELAP